MIKTSVARKILLIGSTFSLPIAVLIWLMTSGINSSIETARLEIAGDRYQRPLEELLEGFDAFTAANLRCPDSGASCDAALAQVHQSIDLAFDHLVQMQNTLGETLQVTDPGLAKRNRQHVKPETLRHEWAQVSGSGPEAQAKVQHLVGDVRTLITHIGDTSGLILDPDLDSYYLMDVTLCALPQTQERLANILGDGYRLLGGTAVLNEEAKEKLAVHRAMLQESDVDRVQASSSTSLNEDSNFNGVSLTLKPALEPALKAYLESNKQLTDALDQVLQNKPVSRAAFYATAVAAQKQSFSYVNVGLDQLDQLLQLRIAVFQASRTRSLLLSFASLIAASLFALFLSRSIVSTMRQMVLMARELGQGDLRIQFRTDSRDELAEIGDCLNAALRKMSATMRSISRASTTLAASSEELSAISTEMAGSAAKTVEQTGMLNSVSGDVTANVRDVASSAGDMMLSIRDIAANASNSAKIAHTAVSAISEADDKISRLTESSAKIGDVSKLIAEVADQTNLLALNAMMESARAGESGKGFAVVAKEVKDLARGTASAAGEIAQKVQLIQKDTRNAADAIVAIRGIVSEMSNLSTLIASSVEEQTAVSNEITRNAADAATGCRKVIADVNGVAGIAQTTSSGAGQTREAANDISRMANQLQDLIATFTF